MNYELARQLKHAGFPQDKENLRCRCAFPEEHGEGGTDIYHHSEPGVYVPTLEELIEAIDTPFLDINKLADGWGANDHYHIETGKTPLEAVARLWLALKTK